jgi:hypothetical protein
MASISSSPSSAGRDETAELNAAFTYIRDLASRHYFGQVILNFQSGHLINVRRDESLKPENLNNLIAARKGVSDVRNTQ